MSVFTPLDRPTLEAFLAPYGLGRLRDFRGIAEGSENTNFFISLEQAECVLTLVERGPVDEMPFFIELLDVLHAVNLPVPYALRTTEGEALRTLEGKPALLQPRLPGKHERAPNPHHCQEVGAWLAGLHLATAGERMIARPSDRGFQWMLDEGRALAEEMNAASRPHLQACLDELQALVNDAPALPQANLHADLFRDNVMFEGSHLTGVIDFYNACSGPMLYDLAITLNDWCSEDDGSLDEHRAHALLAGYAARRRPTALEQRYWPAMLRIACVRFWISRFIAARAFAGQDVLIHDPAEFERRLVARHSVAIHLPVAL